MKLTFLLSSLLVLPTTHGFQQPSLPTQQNKSPSELFSSAFSDESNAPSRRSFLIAGASSLAGFSVFAQGAAAGIDVSGLRVEGGGAAGNPDIANQLKSFDGSGSGRVKEIQAMQGTTTPTPINKAALLKSVDVEDPRAPLATWAYRANPGFNPSLTKAGLLGNLYRYNDQVAAPVGSKRRAIGVQFEFPSDWLQLDRALGGIQYVDQRNGDKLYVLRAPLPEDTTLGTVSKSIIGDLIFDPKGSLIKTGQTVEGYKVSSAQTLTECPDNLCATRRRFKIKYTTVTGNGLSVERRALVDAYQVENDVYMLMTSSNAIKFDKKDSAERETVENIVASFQLDA